VKPHQFMGYYPNKEQFKVGSTETIDLSVTGRSKSGTAYHLDYELEARVRLHGQTNFTIKVASIASDTITWNTINTLEDYIENIGKVMIVIPTYNGDNLSVINNNFIENVCGDSGGTSIPVTMGMYIDANNIPQFVVCDSIPYSMCVPLLAVECLYRISSSACSPSYQTNQFPVQLSSRHITLGTVNYVPSFNNCG
jgi:hypothetical protein